MRRLEGTRELRIGLAGGGPPLQAILDIFLTPDFGTLFSGVRFIAACHVDADDRAALSRLADIGIAPSADAAAMLAAHPDLDMVMELTGDQERLAAIRSILPAGTSLLDQRSAEFFWEVLTSDKLCLHCKLDLRRTQNLLQAINDHVMEDILLLSPAGLILDANRNFLNRLGLKKKEAVGRPLQDVLACDANTGSEPDCTPLDETSPFRETLRTRDKAEAVHTRVDRHGRMLYFRVYTYPVINDQGELESVLEVRRDITRRTHMERRLQQSEKLAAIGELSTFIAHEIRNPLFAIGGFANSLLRAASLDEAAREKVRIILEESRRLDKILKSILNFARPTHAAPGEVDVNQVMGETMELMGIGCDKLGIKVELDYAKNLARAKCDAELLKQCIINLVKNSMEAMPGGGTISMHTGMSDKFISLRVEDTGSGIPPEIQDQVFSPFFSTKDKGSGLGLAMIRKILDDIGGGVELKSRPGEGTSITLFLPPVYAVDKPAEDSGKDKDKGEDASGGRGE